MALDALGIGNALIDFVVESDEEFLAKADLKKGIMQLVEDRQFLDIMNHLKGKKVTILPGGSAANTMIGMARLGAKTAYCGKVGDDFHGDEYVRRLQAAKVASKVVRTKGITGTCISIVTKDKERTMATCLAVSKDLEPADLPWSFMAKSKMIHCEGYQLSTPNQAEVVRQSIAFAKQKGLLISFDCADPFVVKRFKGEIKGIITQSDIIFLNEAEAKQLTGLTALKAIRKIGTKKQIVCLKLGKEGSLVKSESKIHRIRVCKVDAKDTTGAGDLYAAGMLYGVVNGFDARTSGLHASFLAGQIVAQYGAYLAPINRRDLIVWLKKHS